MRWGLLNTTLILFNLVEIIVFFTPIVLNFLCNKTVSEQILQVLFVVKHPDLVKQPEFLEKNLGSIYSYFVWLLTITIEKEKDTTTSGPLHCNIYRYDFRSLLRRCFPGSVKDSR